MGENKEKNKKEPKDLDLLNKMKNLPGQRCCGYWNPNE